MSFIVGDVVVERNTTEPNMTVDKVEKCLDCNKIVITCIWIGDTDLLVKTFNKSKLVMVEAAARPAPRTGRLPAYRMQFTHDDSVDLAYYLPLTGDPGDLP